MGKKKNDAVKKKTPKKQTARIKELKRELKKLRSENAELAEKNENLLLAVDAFFDEAQNDVERDDVRFVGIVGRTRIYMHQDAQASLEDILEFAFWITLSAAMDGVRLPAIVIESQQGLRRQLDSEGNEEAEVDEETMLDILGLSDTVGSDNPVNFAHLVDDADIVCDSEEANYDDAVFVSETDSMPRIVALPEGMAIINAREHNFDASKPFVVLPIWPYGEVGGEAYDVTIDFAQELSADLSQLWLEWGADVEKFAHKIGVDLESAQAKLEVVQTLNTLLYELSGLSLDEARVVGLHKAHPELTQAEVGSYLGVSKYTVRRVISNLMLGWKRGSEKNGAPLARDMDACSKDEEQVANELKPEGEQEF